jgi:hypothetical protein
VHDPERDVSGDFQLFLHQPATFHNFLVKLPTTMTLVIQSLLLHTFIKKEGILASSADPDPEVPVERRLDNFDCHILLPSQFFHRPFTSPLHNFTPGSSAIDAFSSS